MQVTLEYSEEAAFPTGSDLLQAIAAETLRECGFPFVANRTAISLTAVSVSEEKIRELNRTYRDKDAVTDILSFGEYPDTAALADDQEDEVFLGELFFCATYIEAAAKEDGVSFEHELVYIFSHGVLHLLGFDHSDEMFMIQDRVTEKMVQSGRAKK